MQKHIRVGNDALVYNVKLTEEVVKRIIWILECPWFPPQY